MIPILKRAAIVCVGLIALGVIVQLSGAAAFAALLLGLPPERIGYDAAALLTPRKVATAVVFALVAATGWSLLRRDAAHALREGIPRLTPHAVGLFRIALAGGLLWAVLVAGAAEPGLARELQRDAGPLARWSWVRDLAAHGSAAIWVHRALLVAIVAFGAGMLTRAASVAVAALATMHALILLQRQSAHDWGLPVVTLWLLTIVPWGDALSIDAWRRARASQAAALRAPAEYGLALWIPGLALGSAWLAAAFAKFDSTGMSWIADGAVRYHFIEDARHAPVDWGLRVAASDTLSMLTAFGAVVVETLFILNLAAQREWKRLAFGLAGLALLGGFLLFQGVIWRLWWVLLLAFLPWGALAAGRAARIDPVATIRHWQIAVLTMFALLQVVASGLRLEMEPFVSDYGMYSHSWRSREEFDAHLADKLRRYRLQPVSSPEQEEELANRLRGLPGADDVLRAAAGYLPDTSKVPGAVACGLERIREQYREAYGEPMPALRVIAEETGFDWEHGRYAEAAATSDRGTLDIAALHGCR